MESFWEDLLEARRQHLLGDRLLEQTYPKLRDPHLLVSVLMHLYSCVTCAVLSMARRQRITLSPHDLLSVSDLEKSITEHLAPQMPLAQEYAPVLLEVLSLVAAYRKSPVTFSRKDAYVICDEAYTLELLSVRRLRLLVSRLGQFLHQFVRLAEAPARGFEVKS